MDLIYTNKQMEDQAALVDWSLDLAYGNDENNFELQVSIDNTPIEVGGYIYIQDTGYGGIIDEKEIDTEKKLIYYRGRSLEGILEHSIILPSDNAAYYVVSGDANAIISAIIERCGLSNVFVGKSKKAGVTIDTYSFRYATAYDGLYAMLLASDLKMKFEAVIVDNTTKFQISAVPVTDFSKSEEWNSDTINVDITRYNKQVNHLVCLGSGELVNRHAIHLFCDDGGNVLKYRTTDLPIKDADYILDQSQAIYTGSNDVAEIYDYPSASDIVNYELLTEQPSDWATQENFYTKDDETYTQLDYVYKTNYKLTTAQPSDWATDCGAYYYISNGAYTAVEWTAYYGDALTTEPSDWETNYASYYYKVDDGVGNPVYYTVPAAKKTVYNLQDHQPDDWTTNYKSYYTYGPNHWYITGVTSVYTNYDGQMMSGYVPDSMSTSPDLRSTSTRTQLYAFSYTNMSQAYSTYSAKAINVNSVSFYDTNYSAHPLSTLVSTFKTLVDKCAEVKTAYDAYIAGYKTSKLLKAYKSKLSEANSAASSVNALLSGTDFRIVYGIDDTPYIQSTSDGPLGYYRYSVESAPAWQANTYFTKGTVDVAPEFESGKYYIQTMVSPTWKTGTYYMEYVQKEANEFATDTYYRQHTDHFYNLVAAGIEKLAELRSEDKITATIESENDYDVGDIIAINEQTSGLQITQRITKKIVNASDNSINISYTLGG